jgi:hypothetical protein
MRAITGPFSRLAGRFTMAVSQKGIDIEVELIAASGGS